MLEPLGGAGCLVLRLLPVDGDLTGADMVNGAGDETVDPLEVEAAEVSRLPVRASRSRFCRILSCVSSDCVGRPSASAASSRFSMYFMISRSLVMCAAGFKFRVQPSSWLILRQKVN